MPLLTDILPLHQARRQIARQNRRSIAKPDVTRKPSTPRDMRDTLELSGTGVRPLSDVLRDDRAIFMDPWCAATVLAQLATHGVGLMAQISFLGAAQAAAHGQNPLPSFQQFVALSLVLQAVPKTLAAYTGQKWQHAALKRYDQAFMAGDYQRPRTWVMRQGATTGENGAPAPNQEVVRTALFKERLRWGVAGMVDSSRRLLDDVTLAVVNGAFFSYTMGPQFTAAMAVAVGATQGLGWASRNEKSELNRAREAAYTEVFAQGLRVWDNLVLGNAVNRDPWMAGLQSARNAWVRAGDAEQGAQLRRAWLGSLAAGAPMVAAAVHHATQLAAQGGSAALASEFLPVLPRLVGTLTNANGLRDSFWDSFVGQRQNLLDTLSICRDRPSLPVEDFIKPDWITVSHNHGPAMPLPEAREALEQAVAAGEPGRWTIRGRNTAGKSMTLVGLAELAAQTPATREGNLPGSFLLPAKSRLSFAFKTGSSGESGLAHVRETVALGRQVMMFDEYTAHLDAANTAAADALLETAAANHTVVEIRHR